MPAQRTSITPLNQALTRLHGRAMSNPLGQIREREFMLYVQSPAWTSRPAIEQTSHWALHTGGICARSKIMGLLLEPIMWSVQAILGWSQWFQPLTKKTWRTNHALFIKRYASFWTKRWSPYTQRPEETFLYELSYVIQIHSQDIFVSLYACDRGDTRCR
jgi:hypothetical protein